MARVTDMTHGRPIRLILLFSLPLMLGSVFQQLYTIVDTIIIGLLLDVVSVCRRWRPLVRRTGSTGWFYGDCRALPRALQSSQHRSSVRAPMTGCAACWL